jgi:hypothetical protein
METGSSLMFLRNGCLEINPRTTSYRSRGGRALSARDAMSGHTTRSSVFASTSCRADSDKLMDRLLKHGLRIAEAIAELRGFGRRSPALRLWT